MPTTDTPIDLGQHRTARARTNPTTAGDLWAERHGMRTDSHPGPQQVTEADVLRLCRENAMLVGLAKGIDAIP